MAKKDVTLFGFIGQVVKKLNDAQMDDGGAEIATTADVRSIVQEMIDANYINSVVASQNVSKPELTNIANKDLFFANGTPIVISDRTDGEEGALISWNGGEMVVGPKTNVFGGRHADDTLTNSSITIEGGVVNNVFGGGLHKSHTVKSYVKMVGGVVSSLSGGAADQFLSTCTCETRIFKGEPVDSWAVVDDATLELTGGTVTNLLYGGGMGYSCDKKVTMTIGDKFDNPGWTTVGGANGYTGEGTLVISGGTLNIVQGVNRGTMDTINVKVDGGSIANFFVGGETPFKGTPESPNSNDASGSFGKATVVINGGEIESILPGGNSYVVMEEGDPCYSIVDNR